MCGDSVVTTTADSGAGSLRKHGQRLRRRHDHVRYRRRGRAPHTIALTTGELVGSQEPDHQQRVRVSYGQRQ